jgi:spore coat protein CotH
MIRIFILALILTPHLASAQEAVDETAALFDSSTLQQLNLSINSTDLAQLRERYNENTYYPVDVQWRGIRVRNAGVRVRGLASRSPIKPSLNLDFGRYISGQQFLGMNELVLDNSLKDPSMIRDRTSMAFIRRMGQPAPQESFARVFINGKYEGLYTLVEAVDAQFLKRELGDDLGYLFEHKWVDGFHAQDLGEDYHVYKKRFEARTHQLESDSTLYAPIQALFHEVNHEVDGVWRERVGWFIDLPQLVTHVAIEMFLGEVDGFLGYAGMANFYLHRPVATNVHRLIAWDRDSTFQDLQSSVFFRAGENALFSRAMQFADLRKLYLDVLAACARSAVQDRWLESEIQRVDELIRPAVFADVSKPFSNDEYEQAIAHLVEFAQRRSTFVLREIGTAR